MRRYIVAIFVVVCFSAAMSVAQAEEFGAGTLSGKIQTEDGQALSAARVNLFDVTRGPSPFLNAYWRMYDYLASTGEDGSFSLQLPEGTYYLMITKGRTVGPPEEGDLIHPPLDGREPRQYVVKAGETTDIGVISEIVPFKKSWAAKGPTGIQGVVMDKNGTPVEGKLVLASSFASVEKQVFMSDRRTGRDGTFVLRVAEGGQYYVRVRGFKEPIVPALVKTGSMTKGIEIILIEAESK